MLPPVIHELLSERYLGPVLVLSTFLSTLLCTSFLLFARRFGPQQPSRDSKDQDYIALIDELKQRTGPADVFSRPEVCEAPTASMDMSAVALGQAASFFDARGAIHKFKLGEGLYVNMYHTKAGYRRSGDLHDSTQYDVVLAGRVRLTTLDPHTDIENSREYKAHDFIVIPARVPHVFEFLEDNYLLEWWGDDFRAWFYRPMRELVEKGFDATLLLPNVTEQQQRRHDEQQIPQKAGTATKKQQ